MRDADILRKNGVNVDKALEFFGDMETYDETLNDFLEEITPKLERLQKNVEVKNMKSYAIDVHSLKSDAKYFGFDKLAEMAYEHEMKSKEGDENFVINNFKALQTEVYRVLKILEFYTGNKENIIPAVTLDPSKISSNKKTVLVVDDSNIIGNFISRVLNEEYNVTLATNGEECLNILKNVDASKLSAMFLDINMPGISGFDVLNYMSENMLFMEIPVVIITGDSTRDNLDKIFNYPIIDVLAKPFTDENIKRIVEKIRNLNS